MSTPYHVDPLKLTHMHTGELFIKQHNPPPLISHGWLKNSTRSCLMGSAGLSRDRYTLTDSLLVGDPKNKANKWGVREYNVSNATVARVEVCDTGAEHGIYWESGGDVLIEDFFAHDCAANAHQDALRGPGSKEGSECIDPEALRNMVGTKVYRNAWAMNCGLKRGYGRTGFVFSDFEAQGCLAPKRMQSIVGDLHVRHRKSGGIHVAKHRPLVDITFDVLVESCNNFVWSILGYKYVQREAVLYDHIDQVILRGSMIGTKRPLVVKLNNCKKIDYSQLRCNGSTQIQVDGKVVAVV